MNKQLEIIAETLLKSDGIILSAHTEPDGDAVGSVCALANALKKKGARVVALLPRFALKFRSIPGAADIIHDIGEIDGGFAFDTFVSLDCGDKSRLVGFVPLFDSAKNRINIDHHKSNDNFGNINYVDSTASATCEIVYNLLNCAAFDGGVIIDADIAAALYTGILYDTGGFRHRSTSAHTYFIAGNLIERGANFSDIFKKTFYTRKFEETKILAVALSKAELAQDGKVIWTAITSDEMRETGATPGDVDTVVDYLKSVRDTEIAVFFYQKSETEFKASMRSETVDVSEIAVKFGGGGHKNAAGVSFYTTMDDAVMSIMSELRQLS